MKELCVGVSGRADMEVSFDRTAASVGSGALRVFGTPWMIAMMENAACNALAPYYEEGQSSVGTRLDISHDAATPEGMKVWAEAEITEIDRRRIVFKVTAFDEAGQIGTGTHERFLIDTDRFITKASLRGKN